MLRFPSSRSQAGGATDASPPAATTISDAPAEGSKGRAWPIHPILFAIFPILSLFAHNLGQVPFGELTRPLGVDLLATCVIWGLFLLGTRNIRKAAIATAALVLAFFSYEHIVHVLPSFLQALVAPVCILGLTLVLVAVLKTRSSLREATAILNVMSVALIAPSVWAIGASLGHTPENSKTIEKQVEELTLAGADRPPTGVTPPRHLTSVNPNLPDVYYIILDAYGRADRLKEFYGYDNTPFLQALEKRGFTIPPDSRANYDQTPLCLSSALSMNYLDNSQKQLTPEFLRQMVDDNAVAAALRKFGYHYVCIWSGLEVSRVNTADLVLNNQPDLTRFEEQAVGLTPVGATSKIQHDRYDRHRERLTGIFDNLDTVAQLPYQKFVFAHLLAPHPPFVLGANGEAVYPKKIFSLEDASSLLKQISRSDYVNGYIGQLQYVNKRVLQAIDAIQKQSLRPPVIILQGDHGSRMNLDWDSLEKTELREPFSIFNAYCVPEKTRAALYDTITPVNSFRILLNTEFGGNYARLPDRSFYSTADHPYDFTEVTKLTRK